MTPPVRVLRPSPPRAPSRLPAPRSLGAKAESRAQGPASQSHDADVKFAQSPACAAMLLVLMRRWRPRNSHTSDISLGEQVTRSDALRRFHGRSQPHENWKNRINLWLKCRAYWALSSIAQPTTRPIAASCTTIKVCPLGAKAAASVAVPPATSMGAMLVARRALALAMAVTPKA
jgi:hypothetical protein